MDEVTFKYYRRKNADVFAMKLRKSGFITNESVCMCCYTKENLEIDHIVAVAIGGKNDVDNIQILCRKCNVKKGTKIIDYRIKN